MNLVLNDQVGDDHPIHGKHAPIAIEFMFACYVSGRPERAIRAGGWDSVAGVETRTWLKSEGLVDGSYEVTERGLAWIRAILDTPIPTVN